jgi:hypothetical protein
MMKPRRIGWARHVARVRRRRRRRRRKMHIGHLWESQK